MYSHSGARGVNHEWRAFSPSIGELSYVYAMIYRRLGGSAFTSLTSESLGCATFVQLTPANVLLSLANCQLTRSPMPLTNNQRHQLVSLCPEAFRVWEELNAHREDIDAAVKALKKHLKSKKTEDGEDLDCSEVENNSIEP